MSHKPPPAPRYALKIGEIHLRSDHPITERQRLAALKKLVELRRVFVTEDGLLITDVIQSNARP